MKEKTFRLVSLDGLRAVSILLVIIGHISHTDQFHEYKQYFEYFDWSDFGVHIFFVISGFLITTILLNEESKNEKISLKNFYTRRVLRIFPAYYFFIFCIYILGLHYDLGVKYFASSLTFTTGLPVFSGTTGWTLGHTWSLAVEEQFYLLYPFFLVIIRKKAMRHFILFAGVLLFPFLRAYLYHAWFPKFTFSILYRGDCIIWGCLLAFYTKEIKKIFEKNNKLLGYAIFILFLCILILKIFSINFYAGFLTVPFMITFQSLLAVLIITRYTILKPASSFVFRLLNNKTMVFIGMLSYSIYLWQQLVIQPHSYDFFWATFPINIVIIFVLAWLSYTLIETPFLKLRKYFK